MQDAKKLPKFAIYDHCTTLSGYIFVTKACINNGEKPVKQRYLLHMSSQYGELRPTNGWDTLASLGHGTPANLNGFRILSFATAPTSLNRGQPNFARCLAVSWAGTLYIRLLPPNGILVRAKFTLRPSLAFSYAGSVTTWHWSSRRQTNFEVFGRGRYLPIFGTAAITLGIGPHYSYAFDF